MAITVKSADIKYSSPKKALYSTTLQGMDRQWTQHFRLSTITYPKEALKGICGVRGVNKIHSTTWWLICALN